MVLAVTCRVLHEVLAHHENGSLEGSVAAKEFDTSERTESPHRREGIIVNADKVHRALEECNGLIF